MLHKVYSALDLMKSYENCKKKQIEKLMVCGHWSVMHLSIHVHVTRVIIITKLPFKFFQPFPPCDEIFSDITLVTVIVFQCLPRVYKYINVDDAMNKPQGIFY